MQSLYQQKIMDHYHFPRHKGTLSGPGTCQSSRANPSCGDHVTIFIQRDGDRILDARFSGTGCILSLAAADILLDMIIGGSYASLSGLTVEQLREKIGIVIGLTRLRCIQLPLQALHAVANSITG